jgi:hypothetical protein
MLAMDMAAIAVSTSPAQMAKNLQTHSMTLPAGPLACEVSVTWSSATVVPWKIERQYIYGRKKGGETPPLFDFG